MPVHSPKQTFELFFTPRSPVLFLLGALALGVAGNMLSDLAKQYFAPHEETGRLWLILIVALVGLVGLVGLAFSAGVIRQRWLEPPIYRVLDFSKPEKARGLIAFVSLSERAHLEKALDYHEPQLEWVWLIATSETEAMAEELRQAYESAGFQIKVQPLAHPFELLKIKEVVEHIYATQLEGLPETEVVADFTGGTKPMSAAMIFACLSPTRRLQYVPADYQDNKRVPRDPVEYVIDYGSLGQVAPAVRLPQKG